CTRGEWW
nr:immunoglobulin heavy chain junction region [Macaca mulatta]MOW98882.1 immunoglobulin heavy chain junction region [Macaca mulatta]MOW98911.1 immunoglobulin heavy chain junction region [Macaca mulatta]MOW98980.1 immunoglobulin heavy chain junction region [Macaca mulatta]MOW99035.1 immunoglobulin heavy chain junction region [Macaca mulatta]